MEGQKRKGETREKRVKKENEKEKILINTRVK